MRRAAFLALLSHWRRRPVQFLTLILGLALATALWSGVQAINAEARSSYARAASVLDDGGHAALTDPTGARIPVETFAALRRAGWLVSPVIEDWLPAEGGRVRLLAIDPLTAPRTSSAAAATASVGIAGFFGAEGAILAAPATARRLAAYGDRVQVAEGLAPGIALVDIAAAEALTGEAGFTRLTLLDTQPLRRPPLGNIAPNLVREAPDTGQDLARLTDSFHLNLTAFGLLSFAVGLFIVNGTVGLAFEQRRPVFRTLRALGLPAATLVGLLVAELLLFALLAGAIGIALGYGIAAALLPDVAATLRGLYGATVEGELTLNPAWWLSGLAVAVAGTSLASVTRLIQVALMPPLAAAKPRAWARASVRASQAQLLAAGACLLVALAAAALGGGLVAGFLLLGGVLLAAALALPAALGALLGLAARGPRAVIPEWFLADTRHQLPGLSLALMALLLALAANIGVGTMVGSFRLTFTGWLDQRLASELYVSLEDEADLAAFLAFVEPRTDAVLPIWHAEADLLGAPAEIYGVADHPTYRENWPMLAALPDAWDRVAAGQAALINEQLARREGLAPGNRLPMPGGWDIEIAGVYSDYGNPFAQVLLPLGVLTQRFETVDRREFGLRLPEDEVGALREALNRDFGLPAENMVDQAALKAFSLGIFERTFAVTAALNALTLGVAGIALLTSLLTLAAMRLPQLAPVWAIGLPRRALARLELLRALVLAALTFILAVPLGLVLAWILLAVINVEAFGWQLPLHVFPLDILRLFALSLAAAGLAAAWPALRLARRPSTDLLGVFAHER